jgi:hypothetical protein
VTFIYISTLSLASTLRPPGAPSISVCWARWRRLSSWTSRWRSSDRNNCAPWLSVEKMLSPVQRGNFTWPRTGPDVASAYLFCRCRIEDHTIPTKWLAIPSCLSVFPVVSVNVACDFFNYFMSSSPPCLSSSSDSPPVLITLRLPREMTGNTL